MSRLWQVHASATMHGPAARERPTSAAATGYRSHSQIKPVRPPHGPSSSLPSRRSTATCSQSQSLPGEPGRQGRYVSGFPSASTQTPSDASSLASIEKRGDCELGNERFHKLKFLRRLNANQVTSLTGAEILGDMPGDRWLLNQGVMMTAEGHGVPGRSSVRRFSARQDPYQPAVPFADEPFADGAHAIDPFAARCTKTESMFDFPTHCRAGPDPSS